MKNDRSTLTFEEEITAAYLHYVRGVKQEDICAAFSVNSGRVSEACRAIKFALLAKAPGE